jgi:hypothetical protein
LICRMLQLWPAANNSQKAVNRGFNGKRDS